MQQSHTLQQFHVIRERCETEELALFHEAITTAKQVSESELKLMKIIESQSVQLQDSDASDICSIVTDVTPHPISSAHPSAYLLGPTNALYNGLKDKRQMRWHPYMIRFALNLKYQSSSAYKAAR